MSKTIVIINGTGRSGTTNLYNSFKDICFSQHCHNFNIIEMGPGIYKNKKVIDCVKSNNDNIYIFIDVYRDFIDRKMSVFFHNIESLTGRNRRAINDLYKKNKLKNFLRMFRNFLVSDAHSGLASQSWKNAFNYDIFKNDFKFEKKYQIFKDNNYIFINLRFENINEWNTIIKSIDLPIKNLNNFNLSQRKDIRWTNKLYKECRENFRIEEWDFNDICKKNEKIIYHFNDLNSLKNFKTKWEKKIINRSKNKLFLDKIIEKKITSKENIC